MRLMTELQLCGYNTVLATPTRRPRQVTMVELAECDELDYPPIMSRHESLSRRGDFGGKYIPETLVPAIEELEENYQKFKNDKNFKKELNYYLKYYGIE